LLIGATASIAAFFDDPLSGCIFVMEIPFHSGLQRFEVLPAALVASVSSFYIHSQLMPALGIDYSPRLNIQHGCDLTALFGISIPIGILAGGMSYLFVRLRNLLVAIKLPTAGRAIFFGILVGGIAVYKPHTLTWSEALLDLRPTDHFSGNEHLVFGFCKYFAILFTVVSGYSAGIVFPLIMAGHCTGAGIGNLWGGYLLSPFLSSEVMTTFAGNEGARMLGRTFGHCLGSALLAGTMRTPLGTALLMQRMANGGTTMFGMMLMGNLIAILVNPISLWGQKDRVQDEGDVEGDLGAASGEWIFLSWSAVDEKEASWWWFDVVNLRRALHALEEGGRSPLRYVQPVQRTPTASPFVARRSSLL